MTVLQTAAPATGAPAAPPPGPAPAPARVDLRAETDRVMRAMREGASDKPPEPEAPSEKPADPVETPAAAPEGEPPAAEPDDDDADEATDDAGEKPADEAKPDPDLARRLEAVQKQAKRDKEQLAQQREEARREVAEQRQALEREWAPKVEAARKFEQLSKRAQYDAAGVLEALGVPLDAFEAIARQIYARTPKAAANPATREAAERATFDREQADRIARLERQLEERERREQEREREASNAREAEQYMASVSRAVGDDAPLVAKLLAKSPERTTHRLRDIALTLYQRTGEPPEPADVVAELERERRAELEEIGVDLDTVITRRAAPPPVKPPGKTLSSDLGTPTKPRAEPKSREELQEETNRLVREGRME